MHEPLGTGRRGTLGRALRALVPAPIRKLMVTWRRAAGEQWLRGSAVHCPCCRGDFRAFQSYGGRHNNKCPRCGSLERHRVLALYLEKNPELLRDGTRVVHFAPESSVQRIFARARDIEYITADAYDERAMVRVDLRDAPFEDSSTDLVICSHVLTHITEDDRAMRELARILAPDGKAIVLDRVDQHRGATLEDPSAADTASRARLYGHPELLRVYGRDLPARLGAQGLSVEVAHFADFAAAEIERCRLHRSDQYDPDDVYVCSKA